MKSLSSQVTRGTTAIFPQMISVNVILIFRQFLVHFSPVPCSESYEVGLDRPCHKEAKEAISQALSCNAQHGCWLLRLLEECSANLLRSLLKMTESFVTEYTSIK
jgi:hypothetical protein